MAILDDPTNTLVMVISASKAPMFRVMETFDGSLPDMINL
jgi:hypothetical protein